MKICILKCSALLNYGNDFINIGCSHLINKCFPNAEVESFEVLDSAIDNSVVFASYIENYLNSFDYVLIVSGSLISERAESLFGVIASKIKKPKKVLMGIGCFLYNGEEQKICKRIEEVFDVVIVRDEVTYSYFTNKNNNVYLGIDLAFFTKEVFNKILNHKPYMVLNIEPITLNLITHSAYTNSYKEKYEKVYNVENTSTRYNIHNYGKFKWLFKNYLMYTIPSLLYRLYQNADYVITTRLHTTLACLSNQVLVKYVGDDKGGSSSRLHLFDRFIKIQNDKEYYLEDLTPIDTAKVELEKLVKKVII